MITVRQRLRHPLRHVAPRAHRLHPHERRRPRRACPIAHRARIQAAISRLRPVNEQLKKSRTGAPHVDVVHLASRQRPVVQRPRGRAVVRVAVHAHLQRDVAAGRRAHVVEALPDVRESVGGSPVALHVDELVIGARIQLPVMRDVCV